MLRRLYGIGLSDLQRTSILMNISRSLIAKDDFSCVNCALFWNWVSLLDSFIKKKWATYRDTTLRLWVAPIWIIVWVINQNLFELKNQREYCLSSWLELLEKFQRTNLSFNKAGAISCLDKKNNVQCARCNLQYI